MSHAESFRAATKDTHRLGIDLLGDSRNRIEVLVDQATKEAILESVRANRAFVILTKLNDDEPDVYGNTYESIEATLPILLKQ